jgi:hypothetical protein
MLVIFLQIWLNLKLFDFMENKSCTLFLDGGSTLIGTKLFCRQSVRSPSSLRRRRH